MASAVLYRHFAHHFALWLRKNIPEVEDWQQKFADKKPLRTMVDILYRGEHRIINIALALVVATALYFCFAGNLGNAALIAVLGLICAAVFISFMVQSSGKRWFMHFASRWLRSHSKRSRETILCKGIGYL